MAGAVARLPCRSVLGSLDDLEQCASSCEHQKRVL